MSVWQYASVDSTSFCSKGAASSGVPAAFNGRVRRDLLGDELAVLVLGVVGVLPRGVLERHDGRHETLLEGLRGRLAGLGGLVERGELVDQGFELLEAGGVGVAPRRRRDLCGFDRVDAV